LIQAHRGNKTPDVISRLQDLGNQIDAYILESFPNGCFIKLDSRSPKDVVMDFNYLSSREAVKQELLNYLHNQPKKKNRES